MPLTLSRALAAALAASPIPAAAQGIAGTCVIDVSGLDFGTYSSLTTTPDVSIGRLGVTCLPQPGGEGLPRVRISTGNSGHYLDRVMISGGAELHYNLYAEPTRRLVLGDGSAGTIAFPAPRRPRSGGAVWPIFGAIPPGQRVPAGVYSDTLLIEVEF